MCPTAIEDSREASPHVATSSVLASRPARKEALLRRQGSTRPAQPAAPGPSTQSTPSLTRSISGHEIHVPVARSNRMPSVQGLHPRPVGKAGDVRRLARIGCRGRRPHSGTFVHGSLDGCSHPFSMRGRFGYRQLPQRCGRARGRAGFGQHDSRAASQAFRAEASHARSHGLPPRRSRRPALVRQRSMLL